MPALANLQALALLGLAVPIVIFYILKIRLRRVPVATTMFWRQIFDEKKPRSLWQKLRHLVSLLLQIAFLLLLVLALAEPFFPWESRQANRIVLIIDNSASMNATDLDPTRFDKAIAYGLKLIDGLRFRDEMAIVSSAIEPKVYSGLTDHARTLRESLRKIPRTDGPTRAAQAVELARGILADHRNPRIVVLTDSGFPEAEKLAQEKNVRLVTFAKRTGNVGITQFQARRSLLDPIGYEILAEVMNSSDDPVECRLEIDLDGEPVDVVPLKLAPGGSWSQSFEKTSAEGGRLTASINRADALAADNKAYAVLPKREYQNVTLVTEGNLFLEKVFEAIPLVRLTVTKEAPALPSAGTITVFHRKAPSVIPQGRVLVIEPAAESDLWRAGEPLPNPIVAKQEKDSPLMMHVRLDNVLMPEARKLTLNSSAPYTVLAASTEGDPLYARIRRPEGDVLVLTVNLDKSDLPLQTAFPILMTNAMAFFAGDKGELRESVAAGGMTELALPKLSANAKEQYVLRSPEGAERIPPSGAGNESKTSIGPLDKVGLWTIELRGKTRAKSAAQSPKAVKPAPAAEIACNTANRIESDLRPADPLLKLTDAGLETGFGGRPTWYYLIALAWLLAGWEWFMYQRRWID